MKKTIFCILLILMFFVAKDNSIFAQNKVKIGSISLSDTTIGGMHYLKVNAGIQPITIFNQSDTNRIGDIILKDSLGNLVIGANTIINGNLSFANSTLTLNELLTRGVRFSDSLVIRTTIEDIIDYNLYILNDHHTSSIITNLSGINDANKFEITMGNINDPVSYFRISRSGEIYLGGARVYIDSVAFDVSTVLLNNANNTFSGTNTFNGYSAFNNTVELTKGLYIASALIPDTLSLYGTFLLDGVDINNGGLTNVAYKNLANTFTLPQTFDTSASFNRSVSFAIDTLGGGVNYTMTPINHMLIVSLGATNDTITLTSDRNGTEFTIKLIATGGGSIVVIPDVGGEIEGASEDIIKTLNDSRTYIVRNNRWYIKNNK